MGEVHRDIAANAEPAGEPFHGAVLTHHARTLAPPVRRGGTSAVHLYGDLTVHDGLQPEQGAEQFRPSGADQPGQAKHFAAPEVEGRAHRLRCGANAHGVHHHFSRRAGRTGYN